MSELLSQPELQNLKPVADRIPCGKGAIYALYFPDEASAENIMKKFWLKYSNGEMAKQFEDGNLKPLDEITYGQRTSPMHMIESERKNHPGMAIKIVVNGNTHALSPRAEEILQEVLKEEGLI